MNTFWRYLSQTHIKKGEAKNCFNFLLHPLQIFIHSEEQIFMEAEIFQKKNLSLKSISQL